MLFSPSVIVEKVERDFVTSNESFSGFPRSGSLWDECLRALKDPTLMNHIIFNNDVMEIPPVRTFLKASRSLEGGFTSYQKKALGAFWDFVFREVFFYGGQEDNAGVNVLGIRRGSRYTNPTSEVLVGDIDEASGKILMPVPRRRLRMNLAKPRKVEVSPVPRMKDAGSRPLQDDGRMMERERIDDRRTVDSDLADRRVVERPVEDPIRDRSRLEERRVEDLRSDSRRRDDEDPESGRLRDPGSRTEDSRLRTGRRGTTGPEDRSPDENLVRDKRPEDQRSEAERFEAERLEAQRLEVQRLEEQSLEEQRREARRAEDERLEDPEAALRRTRRNP